MRIQHNMMAINANRNLANNNSGLAKALEKLSSGYAINRAGDNAAGLAISEKMRAQIACLDQAETNCNDGVSLIQTAEGALAEVHDMLNRMVELCEQSANGTYDDDVDRANLQSEVKQLVSEIDRIASATNFNGITLLNGKLGGYVTDITGGDPAISKVQINGGNLTTDSNITIVSVNASNSPVVDFASLSLDGTNSTNATAGSGISYTFVSETSTSNTTTYKYKFSFTELATTTPAQKEIGEAFNDAIVSVTVTGDTSSSTVVYIGKDTDGDGTDDQLANGLTLQIGDTADSYNQLTVEVTDMSTKGMISDVNGTQVSVHDVDISSLDGAVLGMDVVKNAINYVSTQRGKLGAMQNRLEHTINNLAATNENITNAESRIRDTDMASEMMNYTSKSILSQAAQSMLAQANQVPQQVLSLLQA